MSNVRLAALGVPLRNQCVQPLTGDPSPGARNQPWYPNSIFFSRLVASTTSSGSARSEGASAAVSGAEGASVPPTSGLGAGASVPPPASGGVTGASSVTGASAIDGTSGLAAPVSP